MEIFMKLLHMLLTNAINMSFTVFFSCIIYIFFCMSFTTFCMLFTTFCMVFFCITFTNNACMYFFLWHLQTVNEIFID